MAVRSGSEFLFVLSWLPAVAEVTIFAVGETIAAITTRRAQKAIVRGHCAGDGGFLLAGGRQQWKFKLS